MNHTKKLITAGLALASLACAAQTIEERIYERFPAAQGAVIKEAFPGFVSVAKGGEVIFVSTDLRYLINGDVRDLAANASLTDEIKAANRPKVDMASLDTADAIRFGTGKHKLFVFADPDCPFCRSLEQELLKLTDASVYVFPMPLDSIHPNARRVSEAIWCSLDRAHAWRTYMLHGKFTIGMQQCDAPLDRNIELAQKLGVTGTPTMIFEDGEMVSGAMNVERIQAKLSATKQAGK